MNHGSQWRLKLEHLAKRFPHVEWAPLVAVLIAAALAWGFLELADEVTEGETASVDRQLLLLLRNPADASDPLGPRFVEELGRDFTALGGVAVLTLLTLTVVAFLAMLPMRRAAVYVAAASGGAMLISFALKAAFARPRPDLVPHGSHVYTSSFPSGHSMMAAAVYLTLGMLIARFVPRRRLQVLAIGVAVLLTVAVGFSRVYLGVHWPSDVIAGWAVGAAWALVCWYVAGWLQRHGKIEQEVEMQDEPNDEN